MPEKLRAGLIGAGRFAVPGHVLYYKFHPDTELVAVCNRTVEKAEKIAKRFRVPQVYSDAEEMLDKAGLDVVSVCTPTFMHPEHTAMAAQRGIHVMCEKPMSPSPEQSQAMIDVCRDNNVKLHLGFHMRCDAGIQRVRDMVRGEKFGACFQAAFEWFGLSTMGNVPAIKNAWKLLGAMGVSDKGFSPDWRFEDPRIPGGVMEVFCHIIDLALWIFGEPEDVVAKTQTISPDARKPEHGVLLLTFPGGVTAYLNMSTKALSLWESNRARFYCENGNIIYETDSNRQSFLPGKITLETDRGLAGRRTSMPALPPIEKGPAMFPHYRKIHNFIRDVQGRLDPAEADIVARGEDGLAVDRIVQKLMGG